jgi:hypothetical protein
MTKQHKPKPRVTTHKASRPVYPRPPLPPAIVVVRGRVVEVTRKIAGAQRLVLEDGTTLDLPRALALSVHRGDWISARRVRVYRPGDRSEDWWLVVARASREARRRDRGPVRSLRRVARTVRAARSACAVRVRPSGAQLARAPSIRTPRVRGRDQAPPPSAGAVRHACRGARAVTAWQRQPSGRVVAVTSWSDGRRRLRLDSGERPMLAFW